MNLLGPALLHPLSQHWLRPRRQKDGRALSNAVRRDVDHWKAEILWALKTVVGKYSYKRKSMFKSMFPDSEIARTFSCGEKKCAYIICFGLAPHFRNELLDQFTDSHYVLLFDESLNHKTQNKQLDIFVRYFDADTKRVCTRYFDSAFIGHATADDMLAHFMELTKKLKLQNMIQLSMDGPNVNWAFFDKLSAELKSVESDPSLINIGSCGLHIIHGAFKRACESVDWDMAGLLRSVHTLFKDTPARREDYEEITGTKLYPLKHCATRWVEDVPVANRLIELLPYIKRYVETIEKHPKKYTVPKTQSFDRVKSAVKDPLTLVKLQFFVSLAEEFLPFLSKFQTDNPVLPFLSTELEKLLKNLMSRCVKSDIIKVDSPSLLLKVDVTKADVLKSPNHVNVGFSASNKLKEMTAAKQLSERQELHFRLDCRNILTNAMAKLIEKCPLKYSLTRNVVCLSPQNMAADPENCKARFSRVLSTLVHCKRISERNCDSLIREFNTFLQEVVRPNRHTFKSFDMKSQSLDEFLGQYMDNEDNTYSGLWDVTRMLLILSHGQASVERGFSVNKGLMVDNMTETSISAQRVVHDHVQSCGGIMKMPITKAVISAAQSGRMRYMQYLEKQKQDKTESEASRKRKLVLDKVHELEKKRICLAHDIESLTSSADELAESAEKKGTLTDLTKSNSFRKSAKVKTIELELIDGEIKKLKDSPT